MAAWLRSARVRMRLEACKNVAMTWDWVVDFDEQYGFTDLLRLTSHN